MSEEKQVFVCKDTKCGAIAYPSPNPEHKGKLEHFCKATLGIVITDPNFPEELTAEKTKDFIKDKKEKEKNASKNKA